MDPGDIDLDPSVTRELFLEWRSPRRGRSNPERMNNPVWEWLVRTRANAYVANDKMGGPDACSAGPGWCFERFGQSSTFLPDGREVLIGGEHEDSYDPDFYIYNDVVVRHPDGRMDIFGYPEEEFPPTDFHSATLVGEKIVLIGSLGYADKRKPGTTQVLILEIASRKLSGVKTSGDLPGWISRHQAELSEDGRSIFVKGGEVSRDSGEFVENIDDWRLDLKDWKWTRLTERRWMRWTVQRKDRQSNSLWHVRQAAWYWKMSSMETELEQSMDQLEAEYGARPDLETAARLYRPSVEHEVLPTTEEEYGVHRVRIKGVVVRYVEEMSGVTLTIEGKLESAVAEALARELKEKLSKVENCEYEAVVI